MAPFKAKKHPTPSSGTAQDLVKRNAAFALFVTGWSPALGAIIHTRGPRTPMSADAARLFSVAMRVTSFNKYCELNALPADVVQDARRNKRRLRSCLYARRSRDLACGGDGDVDDPSDAYARAETKRLVAVWATPPLPDVVPLPDDLL